MNEATKRVADAPAAGSYPTGKNAKTDVKQGTDNEYPPATSYQECDGAYKHSTDDEGESLTFASAPAVAGTTSARKPTILTFATGDDKFARLQLLSTHTLYDLVATLCQYTPVGHEGSEGPDDHLWYITFRGHQYESSKIECQSPLRASKTKLEGLSLERGSLLELTYDYGTTSTYQITLLESQNVNDQDDLSLYPRNKYKSAIPASYQKYQPETNCNFNLLDLHFSFLNDWIFHKAKIVSVNLFQAGRKKNYGFMDNKFTMMYLPTKPDTLVNWLECFNRAASIKPAGVEQGGYAHYTWQSVVALPRSKLTEQLRIKYKSNETLGFCDAPIVEDHSSYPGALTVNLEKTFPKIAALAGLRKDKHVPKGWISFTKRGDQWNLAICKGNARDPGKSNAPKGLAFEGKSQHEPVEDTLFQISTGVEIRGLHDLFCVVEGLLMTL